MTDNKAPIIKPIKLRQYECKQSNYEVAPELPMRSLILSIRRWKDGNAC